MAVSTIPSTAAATLSAEPLAAAQHRAALWADPALAVHAVVMGRRVADLPARLAVADDVHHDCLRPGALTLAEQHDAPHLVQLQPPTGSGSNLGKASTFGDWLLSEAVHAFPDWGVLVRSPARPMTLRNHLRGLMRAALSDGQVIDLDWMDPPLLLQVLLPGFGATELAGFFGPVRSFTVPGADAWRHAELSSGQLARRDVPVIRTQA